jgi:hypothetical protein
MKINIILSLFLPIFISSIKAQNSHLIRFNTFSLTECHRETIKLYGTLWGGLMCTPYAKFSTSEDNNSIVSVYGANIAFMPRHYIGLGLSFTGFGNKNTTDWVENRDSKEWYYVKGFYGGFFVEPIVSDKSFVHISFPITLGMGEIVDHREYIYYGWILPYPVEYVYKQANSVFGIFEPGVEVQFKLHEYVRLGFGIKYRFTTDIILHNDYWNPPPPNGVPKNYPKNILYGPTFDLSLKFGRF